MTALANEEDKWFTNWLEELSLTEYSPLLTQHGINSPISLLSVTKEQLKTVGITKLGHLNRLCKAIEKLKETSSTSSPLKEDLSLSTNVSPPLVITSSDQSDSKPVTSTNGPPVPLRRSVRRRSPSPGGTMSVTEDLLLKSEPVVAPTPHRRSRSLRHSGTSQSNDIPITATTEGVSQFTDSSSLLSPTKSNGRYENVGASSSLTQESETNSPLTKRNLGPPPAPPKRTSSKKNTDHTPNRTFCPPATIIDEGLPSIINDTPSIEISPTLPSTNNNSTRTPPVIPPRTSTLTRTGVPAQPVLQSWEELLKGEVTKDSSLPRNIIPPVFNSEPAPPSYLPPPPPSQQCPPPPPLSELPPDIPPIHETPPLLPPKADFVPSSPPPADSLMENESDEYIQPGGWLPSSESPPPLPPPPLSSIEPIPPSLPPPPLSTLPPPPPQSLPPPSSTLPPSPPQSFPPPSSTLPPSHTPLSSSSSVPVSKVNPPSLPVRTSSTVSEVPPPIPRRVIDSLPPPPPPPITDDDFPEDKITNAVVTENFSPEEKEEELDALLSPIHSPLHIGQSSSNIDDQNIHISNAPIGEGELLSPASSDENYLDMDQPSPLQSRPPVVSPSLLYEPIEQPNPDDEYEPFNEECRNNSGPNTILPSRPAPPPPASSLPSISPPLQTDSTYEPIDNDRSVVSNSNTFPSRPAPPPPPASSLPSISPPLQTDSTYEPIDSDRSVVSNSSTLPSRPAPPPPPASSLPSISPPLQTDSTYEPIDNDRSVVSNSNTLPSRPAPPPPPASSLPSISPPLQTDSTYEPIDSDRSVVSNSNTFPSRPAPPPPPASSLPSISPPLQTDSTYEAIDNNRSIVSNSSTFPSRPAPPPPASSLSYEPIDDIRNGTRQTLPPPVASFSSPTHFSSLPPVPETDTYEPINLEEPLSPGRQNSDSLADTSNGIYEAIDSKSPLPSSSPFKTGCPPSSFLTQSYNEYIEDVDGGSKTSRHTDRPTRGVPGHTVSVKDLARDLEQKEKLKKLRSTMSDGIIETRSEETISPAASRALSLVGVPPTKEGYLFKKGGKRNDKPYQKRWVVFDGEHLKYFKGKGEKESDARNDVKLSEMIDIKRISDPDHNFRFDLVVINRVFQFFAENDDDAQMWVSVLHAAISKFNPSADLTESKIGGNMNEPDKEGFIMKQGHGRFAGFKQRYVALKGSKFAYYETKEDFTQGKPIHVLDMRLAMVKPDSSGRHRFTITMPNQRSYVFQSSNDANRMEWIEKLTNAILTGLNLAPEQKEGKKGVRAADILEKIQKNPSNKKCADCNDDDPSWGVVNRGIMVCIECSGVHRAMGVHISKVRSVELDTEIWTDSLIKLFTTIGNYCANLFWERHFKGERIPTDSPREIRESFIRSKYESKSWIPDAPHNTKEELNRALCVSVANDDLMRTTELLVMGADPCYRIHDASDPELDTPLAIAKAKHQSLQVELLEQNGALIESTDNSFMVTISKKGYVHKTGSDRQGWKKRYCTVDNHRGLEYFKSDTDLEILGTIRSEDILGVSQCDDETGGRNFCYEVITAGRAYLFSADSEPEMNDWISTIKQIIPKDAADKLGYDKVGYLRKKSPKNVTWQRRWFSLKNRTLTYFKKGQAEIASIDLRTVTELRSTTDPAAGIEALCTIHIVTPERTYTLKADTPNDAESWMTALRQTQVSISLSEHALTNSNIPILVHKCLQFVESSGLQAQGIYRLSGERAKIRRLLVSFNQDPRSVMIDEDMYSVHDVTGTLKQFFRTLPEPLFTHKLYKPFLHASVMSEDHESQMYQLQSLIDQLPEVNKETLKRIIGHLLKVIQNEADNKMSQSNIISLFGPTLMTVDGDPQSFEDSPAQYACINHMLNYYKWLFNVNEDEEKKEEAIQSALLKIQAAQQQHKESTLMMSSSTSFLVSIYITNKEGGSCTMKIDAQTTAAQVVEFVTTTKSMPPRNYALFLVLGDAESERPLHSLERVLAVQKPDSYLCIKPNTFADKLLPFDDAYKGQNISLHVQEKKRWRKCPCRVRDNMFIIYKDTKAHSELTRIALTDLDIFVGIEQKRIDVRNPPPTRYPFCLLVRFEDQSKFLCADSADDRLLMMCAVILSKHPDGIQTPIMPVRTTPVHFDARNRGISILNPTTSPLSSPSHFSYASSLPNFEPVIPRSVTRPRGDKGLVEELKKRNSLSPDRMLS